MPPVSRAATAPPRTDGVRELGDFAPAGGMPPVSRAAMREVGNVAPILLSLQRVGRALLSAWGGFGRILIWIAFGALFAGVALSRITLLVERVQFLLDAFHLAVR